MASPSDPPASRTGRDRDVFPRVSRPGPYEAPYDVRRDYQQPFRQRTPRTAPAGERLMPRERG